MDKAPRFVWYGMFLGYVQGQYLDGSIQAYFHDAIGGPGYLLRLEPHEFKPA